MSHMRHGPKSRRIQNCAPYCSFRKRQITKAKNKIRFRIFFSLLFSIGAHDSIRSSASECVVCGDCARYSALRARARVCVCEMRVHARVIRMLISYYEHEHWVWALGMTAWLHGLHGHGRMTDDEFEFIFTYKANCTNAILLFIFRSILHMQYPPDRTQAK